MSKKILKSFYNEKNEVVFELYTQELMIIAAGREGSKFPGKQKYICVGDEFHEDLLCNREFIQAYCFFYEIELTEYKEVSPKVLVESYNKQFYFTSVGDLFYDENGCPEVMCVPNSNEFKKAFPHAFRVFDDDGNLYASGRCKKVSFSPLYYTMNSWGCTYIKYYNKETRKWEVL